MKHIFLFTLNKSENDLEIEGRTTTSGSHEVLINNITSHLKTNNKDWRTFNSNIIQLKKLRVMADYQDIEVGSGKASDSILLSDVVLKHLKLNIKI